MGKINEEDGVIAFIITVTFNFLSEEAFFSEETSSSVLGSDLNFTILMLS